MAIQTNLETILNAKYGADVRQAIHDAIEDCYADGKAGSTDLLAREQLSEMAAVLNTEYGSTVLYNDDTGVKLKEAEITLAEAYTNYDYLDIYTYTTTRDQIHTFSTANAVACIREANVVNSSTTGITATSLRVDEIILSFSSNKIVITDHTQWMWDGVAANSATRTVIDSDIEYTTQIRKVVGRKITANAEVTDIRIGYDGTEYESAGDAVRGQIEQVLGGGSGLTEDVKQALLDCFAHVAWIDDDGQDYYDALEEALYPPVDLSSISAVYTQSGTVYDTDSLDSLKSDLVVTATYTDLSTETVTTYTLSGSLEEGTSTITVLYGGKSTTFNVTVTSNLIYNWDFTESLVDTKSSREASLRGTSSASPTRTSAGLEFDAATQNVNLGEISLRGKTVEVDVAAFDFKGDATRNIRFIMSPTGTYPLNGQGGLLWTKSKGWGVYGQKSGTTTGGWGYYSGAEGTTTDTINMFDDTTIKLVFSTSEDKVELFVDGVSKGSVTTIDTSNFTTLVIGGGYSQWSAANGDQCYDMTISGVRVYAN